MKIFQTLLFILMLGITSIASAQTEEKPAPEVLVFAEQMPEFDGDLMAFISKNIQYPVEAREKGAEGNVFIQFVVDDKGDINPNQIEILRHGVFGMDEEAIRVVKLMPRWRPGKQNGKPVSVKFTLPIRFKLKN